MAVPVHTRITVTVLLFARYAEVVGRDRLVLDLPSPATVADVLCEARALLSPASGIPERPLCAVNLVQARPDAAVHQGDEVAILPPLAGG